MSGDSVVQVHRELQQTGASHLREFLPVADVRTVLAQIQQDAGRPAGGVRRLSDQVSELVRLCRMDPFYRSSEVYQRCHALASQLFARNSRYGFDHAIIKAPGSGPVHWHQDQFYSRLDKDKHSLAFWIPLQAVSPANGGMEYSRLKCDRVHEHVPVEPGSHTHRLKESPVADSLSPVMEIGDVCIHTPMTMHRSHPNNSNDTRIAWILQFNRYGVSRFFRWRSVRAHIRGFIG